MLTCSETGPLRRQDVTSQFAEETAVFRVLKVFAKVLCEPASDHLS